MSIRWWSLLALALAPALGACGDEAAPDKGAEEEALTDGDGKADSFFKPTEHGPLRFGASNQATISAEARFHAWDFTLEGDARVVLTTEISQNLDTVMYLYRREPGAALWGRNIKKNDDFDGNIFSQITHDGDKAEYRVVVKAFKKGMSGAFSVAASCEGDGCPGVGDGGVCVDDQPEVFPGDGGYGVTCAGTLAAILTTPATGGGATSARPSQRCAVSPVERLAMDFYVGYWDDLFGFEDFAGEADAELNVRTTFHGAAGSTVQVDVGGDEDLLIFVFDAQDELVMFYHDEQSPTAGFACAAPGDADDDQPDEDCVAAALFDFPHEGSDAKTSSGATTPAAADLGPLPALALAHFAAEFNLGPEAPVDFTLNEWDSLDADPGAEITLISGNTAATYYAAERFGDPTLVLLRTAAGTRFLCKQAD